MITEPFGLVVADPPWKFGDRLPGKSRGAERNYKCMTVDEIMRYDLPPIGKNAFLFLWRVAAMQQEALDVVRFWGFKPKSEITWVKTRKPRAGETRTYERIGMGRTVRLAHEVCLVCTRGRPQVVDHGVSSVIFAPRTQHSRKPEELQDKARRIAGDVPAVELFARRVREGWTCIGDECTGGLETSDATR